MDAEATPCRSGGRFVPGDAGSGTTWTSSPPTTCAARKVAVTGATGNVGTALLRRLTAPGAGVAEVRGLARRRPPDIAPYAGVRWHLADLGEPSSEAEVAEFVDGVDAVVHLAWALQPGRHPERSAPGERRGHPAGGAGGGRRRGAPVRAHVLDRRLRRRARSASGSAEDWPTTGIPSAQYSRDKSAAERAVREVLSRHPEVTLTVVRPTLVLQPAAGSAIGRYFLGPLLFGAARLLPGGGGARAAAAAPGAGAVVHPRRRRRRRDRADARPAGPRPVQPRRRATPGRRRRGPRAGHGARAGARLRRAGRAGGGVRRRTSCPPSRGGWTSPRRFRR